MMNCLLNIILVSILLKCGDCEVFSSINKLEKLGLATKEIIDELAVLAAQLNSSYVNRFGSTKLTVSFKSKNYFLGS